ncbi:DNA repair protein/CtIP [Phlyctema vagabunda]|uniref:DNA repair protein/CtIP n=1 Tax=Phlyctema vagabunda TaxID=108571 RepID=A0ABR4PL89_9HELO
MDLWSSGREARLARFEEFFQDNENVLALELKDKLVDAEELRELREKAVEYDAIKAELAQSTTKSRQLKESNERLSEELCARLSSRQHDFDEEHKQLLTELEGYKLQLDEARELTKRRDTTKISRSIPGPDGRSSPSPSGESRGVSKVIHNEMVKKYNNAVERLADVSKARDTLELKVRDLKQRIRNWDAYKTQAEHKADQSKEQISQQKDENKNLRARIEELERDARNQHGSDDGNGLRRSHPPPALTQSLSKPLARGPALSAPPEVRRDSDRDPGLQNVVARNLIFLPSQYGAFSTPNTRAATPQHLSSVTSTHAHEDIETNLRSSPEPILPPIPRVLNPDHTKIAATQFVGLEPESHPASDGTTEGSTEGSSPSAANDKPMEQNEDIPVQESPETPVVISTRRVKRKRGKEVTDSPVKSRVKKELLSSSPIVMATFNNMRFHESMDLDEIGEKIDTPKKRRQFATLRQVSDSSIISPRDSFHDHAHDSRVEIANPPKIAPPKTTSVLQPVSPNRKILPRTSTVKPPKRRRVVDERAIETVAEDGELQGVTNDPIDKPAPQPVSDDATILASLMERPSPQKKPLNSSKLVFPKKPFTPSTSSGSRGALLPAASTDARADHASRELLPTSLTDPDHSRLRYSSSTVGTSHDVDSPSLRSKIAPRTSGQKAIPSTRQSTKNVPFRNLPLESLGVEHFKVNPRFNNGYNFAFKDVVRGQEQRRELQGCIKPDCCGGKFRALALELYRDPQDSEARGKEEKMLKEYLGDNSWKLKGMLQEERKETMIQAMTRDLSNKYGKHRHAYARSKTPPGFWNPDFPTTQEQEVTRGQQHQYERDMVELRYKESMRPGGAYMFRDE